MEMSSGCQKQCSLYNAVRIIRIASPMVLILSAKNLHIVLCSVVEILT